MIVIAKPPRRQLPGATGRGRHRQHLAAEAETQVADPAAAKPEPNGTPKPPPRLPGVLSVPARSTAGPVARSAGRVKDISDRLWRAAHQHRFRADHIGATGPGPEQRDRVR